MVDLGYLFSVSALALLGTAILRRFRISGIWIALAPLALSVIIILSFGNAADTGAAFFQGIASGLLALGLYHLWLAISGR